MRGRPSVLPLALGLALAGLIGCGRDGGEAGPASYVEQRATCFGMRCCRTGYGVEAVLSGGALSCRGLPPGPQDCFVDHPTVRRGVRACPAGTYVRGLDEQSNLLTCCFDLDRGATPFASEHAGSAEPAGRSCARMVGPGALLAGVDSARDRLLCATPAPTPVVARLPSLDLDDDFSLDPEEPRGFAAMRDHLPLATWKRLTRHWLGRLFDLPPDTPFLQPPAIDEVETRTVEGGVTRRKIHYTTKEGRRQIPAYLFLPAGYRPDGKYTGVLLMHGHFPSAKEGLGADWEAPPHALALLLAQNGFVTLAPDTRGWGEFLAYRGLSHEALTEDYRGSTTGHYGQLPALTIHDNLASLSVLAAVPGVTKTAAGGLSMGGFQAMWLAALDDRVSSVFLAGSFQSFACQNDPALAHACQTIPGLSADPTNPTRKLLLDAADLAALIAPRPLLVTWGAEDSIREVTTGPDQPACSQTALAGAREVYQAVGAGGGLVSRDIPWLEHEIDSASVLTFLLGRRPSLATDFGTRCHGMHCCPPGEAIAGIHPHRDLLLCRRVDGGDDGRACFVDTRTRRMGALACPQGSYLRGLDLGGKRVTCCPRARMQGEQREPLGRPSTTRVQGLPACPPGAPIGVGLAADRSTLLCARP